MSDEEDDSAEEMEADESFDDPDYGEPGSTGSFKKRRGAALSSASVKKTVIPRPGAAKPVSPAILSKPAKKDLGKVGPDLTTYVMIEVPADGKKGTEKAIYLVPKVAVKPNHTLVDPAAGFTVAAQEEVVEDDERSLSPSPKRETLETDVKITSLDYFTANKATVDLPPHWSMAIFPGFVAFMECRATADLSDTLTSWFTKTVCLDADMKSSLRLHDVTVSSRFLEDLDRPFSEAVLFDVLDSLSSASLCVGLGLGDKVERATVEGLVVPFQAADCMVLVDRRRNTQRVRCQPCAAARTELLNKLSFGSGGLR